ncbi:hypothetical protein X777_15018 [Ooceraea biroi]|uniref:Uncharacterized protein n=1 Tax=Ooceraea biroi TaxID=2015173 RepID=A0A026WUR3_OOCBI|nr:hypothetical protein X777_15018 [Ooceraea biroi]
MRPYCLHISSECSSTGNPRISLPIPAECLRLRRQCCATRLYGSKNDEVNDVEGRQAGRKEGRKESATTCKKRRRGEAEEEEEDGEGGLSKFRLNSPRINIRNGAPGCHKLACCPLLSFPDSTIRATRVRYRSP